MTFCKKCKRLVILPKFQAELSAFHRTHPEDLVELPQEELIVTIERLVTRIEQERKGD